MSEQGERMARAAGSLLAGRRAVVTGAGRGIGRAIAEHLAASGASVVLAARTEAEIEAAAAGIRSLGGEAWALRCDISDDASVAELASASTDVLGGPVDTLVNNAGVFLPRAFADYTLDDWTWILDINVVALVRVTQAFLPELVRLERARIINVSSIAGKKGTSGQAAYNASKHAQIGITRCLAVETGATGLRVNSVCPGFTMTDLIDLEELGRVHGRPGAEFWAAVERASTIKRTVTLDEIAAAVVYLASPAADGVNGQSLVVDGGIVMG
jgi:NAD(P)-dependent dehydrogenase (short-subunit alcohol dehydrogenase family)